MCCLLNNVNPSYALPNDDLIKQALDNKDLFVVCFSNFMDETAESADLVLPVRMPLETWDEYGGKQADNVHLAAGDGQNNKSLPSGRCDAVCRF